ncbi:MAG: hypothetical protein Q7R90_02320 [bacterium]|nr:hypothetical protein [bacterium]
MLYFFSGTDREKARTAMDAAVKRVTKKGTRVVRISDAHTPEDLRAALRGSGMFGDEQIVILDGVFPNREMETIVEGALPAMKKSPETFFALEEKPLADMRKKIEKYSEKSERYDSPGKKKDDGIFRLSDAMAARDRKKLWVGYQRELGKGAAPEAIHGVLFWAAKDMFLSAKKDPERSRGAQLLAILAELPHEARRRGEELEYALERFVLSGV